MGKTKKVEKKPKKRDSQLLFRGDTKCGSVFKQTVDLLSSAMGRTIFHISKRGFFNRDKTEKNQILFDVAFARENFDHFRCYRKNIYFTVNLKHLQSMIKNIKKKDFVSLFIREEKKDEHVLIVVIKQLTTEQTRAETVRISITILPPSSINNVNLPERYKKNFKVYGYPMVISAPYFQKIKKMQQVSKTVSVKMQANNYISIYAGNGTMYSTDVTVGEILKEPESVDSEYSEYSDEEEKDEEEDLQDDDISDVSSIYTAEFYMRHFATLFKLPGLCQDMSFSCPRVNHYPLKIAAQTSGLGIITVYIKDKKQIDYEKEQEDEAEKS
jgi:hypothetical protein